MKKIMTIVTPRIFILCIVLIGSGSFAPHKFYVSKSTIEYNDRNGNFEVTCKFFSDDLENALSKYMNQKVDVSGTDQTNNGNEAIEKYVPSQFHIWFDDQPVQLAYVGFDYVDDMTYCFFEFFRTQQYHNVKIENKCLFSEYPDQQNIVDFSANSSISTVILTRDKPVDVVFR